jgi:plasmid stabilization system protein ParE
VVGASGQEQESEAAEALARLVYSARAIDHLQRAFDHIALHDLDAGLAAASAIRSAIESLRAHPFIGRRVAGETRELVISFGKTGYVALYRFVPAKDEIRVLAIRHQRELDYPY